jgi:hypothetical protein
MDDISKGVANTLQPIKKKITKNQGIIAVSLFRLKIGLQVAAVKAPGFGDNRKNTLQVIILRSMVPRLLVAMLQIRSRIKLKGRIWIRSRIKVVSWIRFRIRI